MNSESKALALVTAKSAFSALFTAKPKLLNDKLAALEALEGQAAALALQIGAMLWQTKATLSHGEFQPWIKKHVQGLRYRQCAYYMKLTLIFVEKTKPSDKGFLALPSVNLKKKTQAGAAKEIAEAMAKFIGELSLNELLIKHGIKGVGLKSELAAGDEPAALTAAEEQQMALELIWSQSYEPAKSLADLLAEKAGALTAEQREALLAELHRAEAALRAV